MVISLELCKRLKEHDKQSGVVPLETWIWHQKQIDPYNQAIEDDLRYAELLGNGGAVVDLFQPESWMRTLRFCGQTGRRLGLAIHPFRKNNPDPRIEDVASREDTRKIKRLLNLVAEDIGVDQIARVFIDAETYKRDPRGVDNVVAWNEAMTTRHEDLYALIVEHLTSAPTVEWYGRNPANYCCTLQEQPFFGVASRSLYDGTFKENKKKLMELIEWSLAAGYESVTAWIALGCRHEKGDWRPIDDPMETWNLADWIRKAQLTRRMHRWIDYLYGYDDPANVNYAKHWAAMQLGLRGLPLEE